MTLIITILLSLSVQVFFGTLEFEFYTVLVDIFCRLLYDITIPHTDKGSDKG
jgi:hypothetical protein